jgi:hypothetical protein
MTPHYDIWLISSGHVPQTPALLSFSLHRLRQVVAIPEEAILRRAMIGSHPANEKREIIQPINVKKKSGS